MRRSFTLRAIIWFTFVLSSAFVFALFTFDVFAFLACHRARRRFPFVLLPLTLAGLAAEVESVESPNSNASSSTNRVTVPPPGLSSTGTAHSTVGTISTLMEDHAQSG